MLLLKLLVITANASFLLKLLTFSLNRVISFSLYQLSLQNICSLLPRKLECRSCSKRLQMVPVTKETRGFFPVNVQSWFLIRIWVNSDLKRKAE